MAIPVDFAANKADRKVCQFCHTHTHTLFYGRLGFCPGLPG